MAVEKEKENKVSINLLSLFTTIRYYSIIPLRRRRQKGLANYVQCY